MVEGKFESPDDAAKPCIVQAHLSCDLGYADIGLSHQCIKFKSTFQTLHKCPEKKRKSGRWTSCEITMGLKQLLFCYSSPRKEKRNRWWLNKPPLIYSFIPLTTAYCAPTIYLVPGSRLQSQNALYLYDLYYWEFKNPTWTWQYSKCPYTDGVNRLEFKWIYKTLKHKPNITIIFNLTFFPIKQSLLWLTAQLILPAVMK